MTKTRFGFLRLTGPVAAAALVATTLSLASAPAAAQSLKDIGNSFKTSLFSEAKGCASKITGFNVASAKGLLSCVVTALKNAAKTALVGLAKSLFRQAVGLLKTNAPRARAKIQELVGKVAKLLPAVQNLARPVLAAIGRGSGAFVTQVSACESKITAISLDSLKNVFNCTLAALKGAGKAAVAGLAQGLFDEFIKLLRTNVPQARSKLAQLAAKLTRVFRGVGALARPILTGLNAGAQKAVDEAAKCRDKITGFNKESAQGVFGCLAAAFKAGGKTAVAAGAKALFDEFIAALKRGGSFAKGKLDALVAKLGAVFPAAKALANPVLAGLTAGAEKFATQAAACRSQVTGFNAATAKGVLGCLASAFKAGASTAGTQVAKGLVTGFTNALSKGAGAAKGALTQLVQKFAQKFPAVNALAAPVLSKLGTLTASVQTAMKGCGEQVNGLDPESAKAFLGCLGGVAKVTAVQAAAAAKAGVKFVASKAKATAASVLSKAKATITNVVSKAKTTLASAASTAKSAVAAAVATVKQVLTDFTKMYRKVARARIDGLISARTLQKAALSAKNRAKAIRGVSQFRVGLQTAFRLVHTMRSRVRRALASKKAGSALPAVAEAMRKVGAPIAATGSLSGAAASSFEKAKGALANLATMGSQFLNGALAATSGGAQDQIKALSQRLTKSLNQAKSGLESLAGSMK